MSTIIDIPVDQIKDPEIKRSTPQPGIDDLSKSIAAVGILQPLIVIKQGDHFHLVVGRRRLMAARQLNMPTVPCIAIEASQEQAIASTLHENLYREDMSVTDEANIFDYLSRKLHYSNKRIAQLVTKSESYVSQRLSLLTWPDKLQQALRDNNISFSVARELSMITNLTDLNQLLGFAIKQGINYRTAQRWRKDYEIDHSTAPAEESTGETRSPSTLETITLGRCSNCKKEVPLDQLTPVYLCEECYKGTD
jgi:ParB family chromosome partitioning protein